MQRESVPFEGNINFNAQHSPIGAFMSFTCGYNQGGGGIGVGIGKPAAQNLYIGVKKGDRKATGPIRCLPFYKGGEEASRQAALNYQVEHVAPAPTGRTVEAYPPETVQRYFGWATDCWTTPDFSFSVYTPFAPMPDPGVSFEQLKDCLLPAVVATLEVDNRQGRTMKTAVFAIDFIEAGVHVLRDESQGVIGQKSGFDQKLGFVWGRNIGVLGKVETEQEADGATGQDSNGDAHLVSSGEFLVIQRWSVAEGVADINPVHALGNCAGLAIEVPPGMKRTLVLAIGVHVAGIATNGLEARYFYTRYYSGLHDVLTAALERSGELRAKAEFLDSRLLASGLSTHQQFMIAHGTRGYYGNTQLLEVGGEPLWVVAEGEYCMINTLDLSVDQVFWELKLNPWVVKNILDNFSRRYSYHDQVKTRTGQILPGGISFCHDMGINNNFSPTGNSSYELAHLNGCFSYMTQEQLCNWVLMAACYVTATRDTAWMLANRHLFDACAQSMSARANPRTGLMAYDSTRCDEGQEITTYDSLDESLGQARANTYLGTKCWATWIALDLLARLRVAAGDLPADTGINLADALATTLTLAAQDGSIPAVLEKDNPGYHSRILPVIESLIYPAYWLGYIESWPADATGDTEQMLKSRLQGPFIETLRRHALHLLMDPDGGNLFEDGGIKLSSSSNNSWMSKIAIVQYVARSVLALQQTDGRLDELMRNADKAHVKWQTDGSGYWACSDQFINGEAKGSRYYPRIITAALWMEERRGQPSHGVESKVADARK